MIQRLQIGARRRLLAAQRGEPDAVVVEAAEQRFDFAHAAAAVGRGLVEDAELRFLLGDGELGEAG